MGYARWENFQTAIQRAMEACEASGHGVSDHFRGVTKMIDLGGGSKRQIDDVMLTRYACYLLAQNGEVGTDTLQVVKGKEVQIDVLLRSPPQIVAEAMAVWNRFHNQHGSVADERMML